MNEDYIYLKCIKEGSRLRVRILTPGYYNDANCQFPKNIRRDGQVYKVPKYDVSLVSRGAMKWFYNVKKHHIELINGYNEEEHKVDFSHVHVYEDETTNECCICFDAPKNIVFIPCGHFYCCSGCSNHIDNCPICRIRITNKIDKDLIG